MIEHSPPYCLIAEDQALIGMALEATLEDAGIEVAGPFPSCAEASSCADARPPSLAILDFKLRDGDCAELAMSLVRRGVPVIIYSGLPRRARPPELDGVTWLEKPVDRESLLKRAAELAPHLPRRVLTA